MLSCGGTWQQNMRLWKFMAHIRSFMWITEHVQARVSLLYTVRVIGFSSHPVIVFSQPPLVYWFQLDKCLSVYGQVSSFFSQWTNLDTTSVLFNFFPSKSAFVTFWSNHTNVSPKVLHCHLLSCDHLPNLCDLAMSIQQLLQPLLLT